MFFSRSAVSWGDNVYETTSESAQQHYSEEVRSSFSSVQV